MKKRIDLIDNWSVTKLKPTKQLAADTIQSLVSGRDMEFYKARMPEQVHEILLRYGEIEDPGKTLDASLCLWVGEYDWVYVTHFSGIDPASKAFITFTGLDTFVEIYLNGVLIAKNENMYTPLNIPLEGKIKQDNSLIVHFHSPEQQLRKAEAELPKQWQGLIKPCHMLKKSQLDFSDFLGARPYFMPVGIFGEVFIEIADVVKINYLDIRPQLDRMYERAKISVRAELSDSISECCAVARAYAPDCSVVGETVLIKDESGDFTGDITFDGPKLWWPIGYGAQPLYSVELIVSEGCEIRDRETKQIGFREVKTLSPFEFIINNVPVRLWGANLEPVLGFSHCWNRNRMEKIIELAINGNLNSLRVWAGGEPLNDEFYCMADKAGLLLWQEFYYNYGMYPDTDVFREECRREVKQCVKTLKHHPSVLFWCGGNESQMGADFDLPGKPYLGGEMFEKDFKNICKELDPDRWYHPNSPYGGKFSNDPFEGDTHGYHHEWFVRGANYPIMIAENTRVSIPNEKTLKVYFAEDNLWPEAYTGIMRSYDDNPLPETWKGIVWPAEKERFIARTENAEKFYDAHDLTSLIYKYGAAHGTYLRDSVERMRRSRPSDHNRYGVRRCMGAFVWKFNDPWPQIYCGMTDYFLEPTIAYYYMKRAYEPVLLSFDQNDSIFLWMINDTARCISGQLSLSLFDTANNCIIFKKSKYVMMPTGDAQMLMTLDEVDMPSRQNILFAEIYDDDGNLISRATGYLDIERKIGFPKAKISLSRNGDDLLITGDLFARSVELSGGENGMEFGWLFDDNYFDLFPFEEKRVKVLRKGKSNLICAKANYSTHISKLDYGEVK